MANKSYNVMALKGYDVDDMDTVEYYDLDPALAYTPGINEAVLEAVYQKNIKLAMKKGKTEIQAKKEAATLRKQAAIDIERLMK